MEIATVMPISQLEMVPLKTLLENYSVNLEYVESNTSIPGSFWGDSEAGLIGNTLYVQDDTPVHSMLHELCHYICMSPERRQDLHTNAGGGYDEENAVCYLQILLADYLPPMDRESMLKDMDNWGYSFRLGSAKRWFMEDADDAKQWLVANALINAEAKLCWQLRQAADD